MDQPVLSHETGPPLNSPSQSGCHLSDNQPAGPPAGHTPSPPKCPSPASRPSMSSLRLKHLGRPRSASPPIAASAACPNADSRGRAYSMSLPVSPMPMSVQKSPALFVNRPRCTSSDVNCMLSDQSLSVQTQCDMACKVTSDKHGAAKQQLEEAVVARDQTGPVPLFMTLSQEIAVGLGGQNAFNGCLPMTMYNEPICDDLPESPPSFGDAQAQVAQLTVAPDVLDSTAVSQNSEVTCHDSDGAEFDMDAQSMLCHIPGANSARDIAKLV
eukprot:CAMPEP_0119317300 /NCGR_PEP_ID=MMETSP1333-20130426/42698_1 /TAXON_ID=418940 /ORGANISM="Scyphosphaera apsteinii, Strain RCC1455" /LENGTH=269 /DNA_ID=CAMNT_0007323199 /DNA_START=162 /DNA_END=968 /DNA_ORIENTATION=+